MISLKNVIGALAIIVGTSLMFPQVVRSIRTKKVDDLELWTLILYFFNCTFWLIYGYLDSDKPIVICNSIGLVMAVILLFAKFKYQKQDN